MENLKFFKPGEVVPVSGVYLVLHSSPHTLISQQEYIAGARFPSCRLCPLGAWYRFEPQPIPASSKSLPIELQPIEIDKEPANRR
jgi:hypothetical protein